MATNSPKPLSFLRHAPECMGTIQNQPCTCGLREMRSRAKKEAKQRNEINKNSAELLICLGELVDRYSKNPIGFEMGQAIERAKALCRKLEA